MSVCPMDENKIPSKKNCGGCQYFEYDESNDGEGIVINYFCSYKEE